MHTHPGRYIILRIADSSEPRFTARVFAQCQLAFGRRQQICCEQVEFVATADRVPDFYTVALGITVADLPILLWIKRPELLLDPDFRTVLQLARPLILDSGALPGPASVLTELVSLRRAGWRIKDLAWTRLTVWRETVAQLFEAVRGKEFCGKVERIELTTPGEARTDAFYLAAWLSRRLPGAAVSIEPGESRRLRLIAGERPLEILEETNMLSTQGPDGLLARVQHRAPADADLLAEELSILGPDPIFDTTLADAEHRARTGAIP
jgi:glucose-6-phosphate dehydrogenase assembly protein OpcA